jgi:hypothetical protein
LGRIIVAFAFAGVLVSGFGSVSQAAPALGPAVAGDHSAIIQVDSRCGRDHHYVPRHRNHAGHLVAGYCAPDHHPDHH